MSYVELAEPREVTTRKAHRCGWCNERIPSGTPGIWYRAYVFEDRITGDWMHPECHDAMCSFGPGELDEWMPGDFARGGVESV
jgi:hypothetical protein